MRRGNNSTLHFVVGEYARHEPGGIIEGEIVSVDYEKGTVRIFNMLAPVGSRNFFTVKSGECIRVSKREEFK